MQNMTRITKEELIKNMKAYSLIYDVVRLVEPESIAVVTFGEKGTRIEDKKPCFSVWEKDKRCKNCISLRACTENRKITKFEFRDNETFSVVAIPYIVIDGDDELRLSMELVNRVEDNLVLEADGFGIQPQKIMEINQRLYQDSLTGAYNRRYYDENRYVYDMAHTLPEKMGYLAVDVNHFKQINDQYGHTHGDEVLAKIAEVLKLNVRLTDRVVRTGGDEFLIVLRDCTAQFLKKKNNQIKRAVTRIRLDWMTDQNLTIAVGMSYTNEFKGSQEELKDLFNEADAKMYEDKNTPVEFIDKKAVLIVDDVKMNRSVVSSQLGSNFLIYEAANGIEALDVLKKCQIDLIITYIFMDGMNGYDLMRHVKEVSSLRDIPIIAVTENSESSQKKAIEAGADIYIDRPLGSYLPEMVLKMTGRDHGRKELFDMDFLLDTIPGAVIVYKIPEKGDMEIVSCSRGVSQLTGWEADELCSFDAKQKVAAFYPADFEKFTNTINRMLKTHSRGEVIYRGYKKDGSIVWVWFQGRYIGEEDGCAIVEAIHLDVSNNTNMYQNILDASPSAITVVDAHTFEVLYVNQKGDEVINKNHDTFLGSTCYEFVFHRNKPCERCIANYKRKEWNVVEFERDGKTFKTSFRRIVWHGIEAFLEYTEDISAIKENIAYAEDQKKQQSLILQNIPTGIVVYRWNGTELMLVEVNQSLCEMMQISKDKLKGYTNKDFVNLVYKEDFELCKDAIHKLFEPDKDVAYEFRTYHSVDHKYVWMSGHGRSVKQPDGSIYIYFAYTDISARKELEHAEQKLLTVEKTAEAKAEFYSRMSHDMRTPMNGILGITEIAKEDRSIEEMQKDLGKIEQSGKYMMNLINDTLDYQRLDSGKTKLNPDVIYAQDFLQNTFNMVQETAKAKGVQLIHDVATTGMDWYMRVDEMHLKQIFVNILSNAIKFTPSGGKVSFNLEHLGQDGMLFHEKFVITDTGIGMSEKFIKNDLFKPFSQEMNEVTTTVAGSGLGLSIVKSLVEIMGGRIEVESEIGTGTTFIIYLDIERVNKKEVEEHNKKDAARMKPMVDLIGKKILLCEDHPLNAEIVKRLLGKVHAEVEWAKDGEIGVEMFKNSDPNHYAAILMDIRMPKMDGLEATRQIRASEKSDAKTVPIIAMSANAYDEDKKKSMEAGMNEHLFKPIEAHTVYETLEQYIMHTGKNK